MDLLSYAYLVCNGIGTLFVLFYVLTNGISYPYFWFFFILEHHWWSSLLLCYQLTLVKVVADGLFRLAHVESRIRPGHSQMLRLFRIMTLKLLYILRIFYNVCAYPLSFGWDLSISLIVRICAMMHRLQTIKSPKSIITFKLSKSPRLTVLVLLCAE